MSGQAQADQVETQAAQVEEEYRREEKHENKTMDAKFLTPKFQNEEQFVSTVAATMLEYFPMTYSMHGCIPLATAKISADLYFPAVQAAQGPASLE